MPLAARATARLRAAASVAGDSGLTHRPALCWVLTVGYSPQVLHNRAFVYRKLGEYRKAIGDYSKVRWSRRRFGRHRRRPTTGRRGTRVPNNRMRRKPTRQRPHRWQVLALAPRNTKTLNHRA